MGSGAFGLVWPITKVLIAMFNINAVINWIFTCSGDFFNTCILMHF
jgi:hypothetical protein